MTFSPNVSAMPSFATESVEPPQPLDTDASLDATAAPRDTEVIDGWMGRWGHVWHAPVLLLGLGLVAVGVYLTLPTQEKHDFDSAYDTVEQYLLAGNFDEARSQLTHIEQYLDEATPQQVVRHLLLSGDVIFHRLHEQPTLATAENLQRIVRQYREAQDLAPPLDDTHAYRLAEVLAKLGREDEALAIVDALATGPVSRRYGIIRSIIESHRKQPSTDETRRSVSALLEQYDAHVRQEPDDAKRRAGRIWSLNLRASMLLEASDPDAAGRLIEHAMIRLMDERGDDDLGPTMVLLARSYQQKGEFDDAERWYLLAQQKLSDHHPTHADVLIGLGELTQARSGDDDVALQYFKKAESEFPDSPRYLTALMGRADAEARLGASVMALGHFRRAAHLVSEGDARVQEEADRLGQLLHSRFDAEFEAARYDTALDYLTLLRGLSGESSTPRAEAMFAATHEHLGEQYLSEAAEHERAVDEGVGMTPQQIQKRESAATLARQNAAVHFEKAGDHHVRHARLVTVSDDEQFGDALWAAAGNYDKARRWQKAIEVYAEYVKARPEDPRRLDAMHRLALAYESDNQHRAAVGLFQELVDEHPRTQQAYDSLVPLARSHIELDQVEDAKRVLRHVITDHEAITPDSQAYQESLIALGQLHYRQNEFTEAIEKLEMAVKRYGDTDDGPRLRYLLGDAYRQSVRTLDDELARPMPAARKAALDDERTRRLEQAAMLFSQVVNELEARSSSRLSNIESLYLRNAYFYRADAMYDLGRYEQAITLYDEAAGRWDKHPASLIGLIQIVNAYCELDRYQEARVANDRARWQLNQIPDAAFDDPTLPMSRRHWQEWLKWTSKLKLFEKGEGSPSAAAGG